MLEEPTPSLLRSRLDAARILGISLRKLELLIEAKELRVARVGRRVLVPQRALEEFVRRVTQ